MRDCPSCNCENMWCPDITEEYRDTINTLRDSNLALSEALRGLMMTSKERPDDYIFKETGFHYWLEKAWDAIGGRTKGFR